MVRRGPGPAVEADGPDWFSPEASWFTQNQLHCLLGNLFPKVMFGFRLPEEGAGFPKEETLIGFGQRVFDRHAPSLSLGGTRDVVGRRPGRGHGESGVIPCGSWDPSLPRAASGHQRDTWQSHVHARPKSFLCLKQ